MDSFKKRFLDKYNPDRSVGVALSKAIAAAVSRNSLYRESLSREDKAIVRQGWQEFLLELSRRYEHPSSVAEYESDISALRSTMNRRFSSAFRDAPHARYKTDAGFRISHGQKSIAVFLKHLWCMQRIAAPPQCPVDARILSRAGAKYPDTRWGYVNSLEEHRKKTLMLAKCAEKRLLAEWELEHFDQSFN